MLRQETKRRARAVQILYAWEAQGRPPLRQVVASLLRVNPRCRATLELAEPLAEAVVAAIPTLDADVAAAAEHWRFERIGAMERHILRVALYELAAGVPPRVAISEAVRLAHWFAGPAAPAFVNGVLDALARRAGRL